MSSYKEIASAISDFNKVKSDELNIKMARFFLMTRILSVLPEIMVESPEINLSRFEINTPDGIFLATAKITADGDSAGKMVDISKLLKTIDANLSVKIPAKYTERYFASNNSTKRNFLWESMLVKKGDSYEINLKYKNANLIINGELFSFPTNNK